MKPQKLLQVPTSHPLSSTSVRRIYSYIRHRNCIWSIHVLTRRHRRAACGKGAIFTHLLPPELPATTVQPRQKFQETPYRGYMAQPLREPRSASGTLQTKASANTSIHRLRRVQQDYRRTGINVDQRPANRPASQVPGQVQWVAKPPLCRLTNRSSKDF